MDDHHHSSLSGMMIQMNQMMDCLPGKIVLLTENEVCKQLGDIDNLQVGLVILIIISLPSYPCHHILAIMQVVIHNLAGILHIVPTVGNQHTGCF